MPAEISTSEAILRALHARLVAAAPRGAEVLRNAVMPMRIPCAGVVILRDGEPGSPEVTMSPVRWHYEHRAVIEMVVSGGDDAGRDAAFDALRTSIAPAVSDDRTLGGLVDWVEADAPAPDTIPVEGGDPMKGASVSVMLIYSTLDPLL